MSNTWRKIFCSKWRPSRANTSADKLFSRPPDVSKVAWRPICSKTDQGAQGAKIGLLEYLSQSNCVNESERYKFLDDLSILEIINLLTIGLTSFNLKRQVASDIPQHNQFIPAENLKSRNWLNQISDWTKNRKMKINVNKTKTMIFNYTDKYQFTTRLAIAYCPIDVIKSTKLCRIMLTLKDLLFWTFPWQLTITT